VIFDQLKKYRYVIKIRIFSFSHQYATLNQGKGSVFMAYTITRRIDGTNKNRTQKRNDKNGWTQSRRDKTIIVLFLSSRSCVVWTLFLPCLVYAIFTLRECAQSIPRIKLPGLFLEKNFKWKITKIPTFLGHPINECLPQVHIV
jgi:hypothetical protein